MSRVYLHNKKKVNSLIKKILYLLIMFVICGFYKNGINLYKANYVSLLLMFKPLFLVFISVIISIMFAFLFKEKVVSYRLLSNLLISVITPVNTSIWMFILLILGLNFIYRYYRFNMTCTYMVIISLILFLLKDYSYLNIMEQDLQYKHSLFDLTIGKGIGGIGNTFLLGTMISFIFLNLDIEYKKKIPYLSFGIFVGLSLFSYFFIHNFDVNTILNNNLLFGLVFIAPISIFTPYTKGGRYLYGILLGILIFIFSFWDLNLGVYIAILISGFISPFFDKIIVKNGEELVDVL